MDDNFYVRGDGTRVYFFEEEELRRIWSVEGGFEVRSFGVDRRMLVNRQRRLKMYRCWMQAVFRKPLSDGSENVGPKVDELADKVAATSITE
jgi:tRNAThr (cytosine32-N3)-methyltransferase